MRLRSVAIASGAVLLLLATACAPPLPDPTARNLVIVSLDTLRADRLGTYGYGRETSPKLDAWARKAFVFGRATSAGNATVGAHHAIFQSRVASRAIVRGSRAPTLAQILRQRGYRTAGYTDGGTMARALGFARGFEHFDDHNRGLATSLPKALPWLERVAAGDAPFYLFVHTFDVHLPYDPPAPYDTRFDPEYTGPVTGKRTLPLLRGVRRIFEQANREEPVRIAAAGRRKIEALYDGEIAKTDDLLAKLLERIDAPDLRDDTLVVVLSDHGEEFWDHGSVLHSHTLYQELLHVPLLIRVPAWRDRARRIDARISMLDVLPTLLELLGVPAPEGIRGRSLLPLMRGEALPEVPILSEGYPFGQNLQSVTLGDWKLIRSLPTGKVELYDLKNDPLEQRDLSRARPHQRGRLLAVLDGQLAAHPVVSPEQIRSFDTLPEETRQRLRELGYID
jgi:arylsulfatase A-like enzyme